MYSHFQVCWKDFFETEKEKSIEKTQWITMLQIKSMLSIKDYKTVIEMVN